MDNELRLDLDGTAFRFFFSDKGFDDCGYFWTDACISVENRYFNYQRGPLFLTFAELQEISKSLTELLNDGITEERRLGFIEPDLEISLNPDPKFDNISAEFIFYLSPGDCYTDQRYTLPLYRSEMEKLVKFLNEKIASFT